MPRSGQGSSSNRRISLRAQRLALGQAGGEDHELGEVGLRELLVERQVEARAAAAHPGHVVLDALLLVEEALQALHRGLGGVVRHALGQAQVDQQLGPCRVGEELLRHKAGEHEQRADEDRPQ
jgi:hypothetical protein